LSCRIWLTIINGTATAAEKFTKNSSRLRM
jgi:hypothetical protein